MDIRIFAPEEIIETTVELPLSKSLSARALIMSALTPGHPLSGKVADCDDTAALLSALSSPTSGDINIGAAGTAMRFLTAYYAATVGAEVTLDGSERMRQRPIGVLVDALRACGADIEYAGEEGFPPLRIRGRQLHGGNITVDASVSSQFVSALMMVAPTFSSDLTIRIGGDYDKLPYVKMTAAMMQRRGNTVDHERERGEMVVTIAPGPYSSYVADIEADWSAAGYWYEIAALSSGWVTLPGLRAESLQGDSAAVGIFDMLGVTTAFTDEGAELSASPEIFSRLDIDMSATPDMVQTLAVTCCMLGVPFRFDGVHTLRVKETDRIAALTTELRKFGFILESEGDDVLMWEQKRQPVFEEPVVETYGDHRMAMAFAPICLFTGFGLQIRGAEVVSKSYPAFWDHLKGAGFTIETI